METVRGKDRQGQSERERRPSKRVRQKERQGESERQREKY
jgi:hypothetical protein